MQNGDKEAGLLCNWLPRDIFLQVKPRRTTKIYSIWGEHTGIMLHVNWQASYHKFMLSLMTKYVQHSVSFWSFFGTSVFFFLSVIRPIWSPTNSIKGYVDDSGRHHICWHLNQMLANQQRVHSPVHSQNSIPSVIGWTSYVMLGGQARSPLFPCLMCDENVLQYSAVRTCNLDVICYIGVKPV